MKIKLIVVFTAVLLVSAVLLSIGLSMRHSSIRATTVFTIPSEPPCKSELEDDFTNVGMIDDWCDNNNVSARILNFNFATPTDLSDFSLGSCTYIPVQITTRTGGRKSQYYLDVNEEVLAGIFVNSEGYLKRYVKRLSGSGVPVSDGDEFQERWTTYNDTLVYRATGELDIIDADILRGQIVIYATQDSPIQTNSSLEWWFGSAMFSVID